MPNPEPGEIARVLKEAHSQAISWIENRSQVSVAPAAIAVPDIELPEHGSAAIRAPFVNWQTPEGHVRQLCTDVQQAREQVI